MAIRKYASKHSSYTAILEFLVASLRWILFKETIHDKVESENLENHKL